MKEYLIGLIFLCSFQSQAQKDSIIFSERKVGIGITYSFDYTSASIPNGVSIGYGNTPFKDSPILGFTYGINFTIPFRRKISFVSGFLYSKKGYKITFTPSSLDSSVENLIGEKLNYYYLEIPLKFRYDFCSYKEKRYFFGTAGTGFNFQQKTLKHDTFHNTSTGETSTYHFEHPVDKRKARLSFSIGVGYEQKVTKNFNIIIHPEYMFLNRLDSYARRVYSISCHIGVFYKF